MRYYFLALGALVVVCMGCAGYGGAAGLGTVNGPGGHGLLKPNEYVAPPAAMMQHPGPMVDGPGPGVLGMLAQPGGPGLMGPGGPPMSTQIKFIGQDGMSVGWMSGAALARNQRFVPGMLTSLSLPFTSWCSRTSLATAGKAKACIRLSKSDRLIQTHLLISSTTQCRLK